MVIKKLNEDYDDLYDDYYTDSDSYEDDISKLYDDELSDFSDNEIRQGDTIFASGEDYTLLRPVSDIYHMDFDSWQVWEAVHKLEDTYGTEDEHDELAYFIIDIDTGFIDWGPVETKEEAKEFLDSKYDDYLNDVEFS